MTPISAWNKIPRRTLSTSRRQAGFTLLEVMVAVSLLAIALTTLFGSQAQSVSLASAIKFNTQASLLARQKLSEFTKNDNRPAADSGDFGDEFPGFRWQLNCEAITLEKSKIINKLTDSLQRVTLTVTWGDKDQYAYQLQSYLPKKPES